MPIFVLIGLFFNILSLRVLRNKNKKKDLKQVLFIYAQINNYFDIFLNIFLLLKLLNKCEQFAGIYCPVYYTYEWVQICF